MVLKNKTLGARECKLIAVLRMLTRGRERDTGRAGKESASEGTLCNRPDRATVQMGGNVRNQRRDVARGMGYDC